MNKHSSLLPKFVNYGLKKFYNIGPWTLEMSASPAEHPVGKVIKHFSSSLTHRKNKLERFAIEVF